MSMDIIAQSIATLSATNANLKAKIGDVRVSIGTLKRFLPGFAAGASGSTAPVAMAGAIKQFAEAVNALLQSKIKLTNPAPNMKAEQSAFEMLFVGGYHDPKFTKFAKVVKEVNAFSSKTDSAILEDINGYNKNPSGSPLAALMEIFKGPKTVTSFENALYLIPEVSDVVANNQDRVAFEQAVDQFTADWGQSHSHPGQWNVYASEKKPTKSEQKALKDHPEFVNNALRYFTYNTTPVIDPCVENPNDDSEMGINPGDVTGKDLIGLATYAAGLADPRVDEGPGGREGTVQDAVLRAIAEKDDGKFSGRINAETSKIIADKVTKMLGTKALSKPENQNNKYMELAEEGQKADHKDETVSAEIGKYEEPRIEEDATIERPVPRTTNKEASMSIESNSSYDAGSYSVLEVLKLAAKKPEGKQPAKKGEGSSVKDKIEDAAKTKSPVGREIKENKAMKGIPPGLQKALMKKKASEDLDAVANQLQDLGLTHLATQLDIVSNTLSAEAKSEEGAAE